MINKSRIDKYLFARFLCNSDPIYELVVSKLVYQCYKDMIMPMVPE